MAGPGMHSMLGRVFSPPRALAACTLDQVYRSVSSVKVARHYSRSTPVSGTYRTSQTQQNDLSIFANRSYNRRHPTL